MPVQLTKLDVETIAALQAIAAAAADAPIAELARQVGRDDANFRKTLKTLVEAGRLAKVDGRALPALTEDGRAVLAMWDRAHNPAPDAQGAEIPLHLIDADEALNPRTHFDAEELADLTASVGDKGVLQPILVRPSPEPGRFRVVAGERRRRAAVAAGLFTIPALVRELDDAAAFEVATIENLQRADMNPLDEARAFAKIIADRQAADPALSLKAAKEAVGETIRKSVRYVELRLDLLKLPPVKQLEVAAGKTTAKDAIAWQRSQPKPLELTPRQWLIALEVYDAQLRAPAPKRYEHESASTFCRAEAAADEDVARLSAHPTQLLSPPHEAFEDGERTGRFKIRFVDFALDQLRMRFGDVADPDERGNAHERALVEAGIHPDDAPAGYATPWLNGPFDPAPELLAEIAAAKAAQKARDEARERQAREEAEAREAALAAGQARLAIVEAAAWGAPVSAWHSAADLMRDGGKPLPWCATGRGGILAANGEPVLHDYPAHADPTPDTLARVKLIAFAVNSLAGVVTPETPPAPPEQQAAEPNLADILEAEAEGYEPDADDEAEEDEGELEDASAEDYDAKKYPAGTPKPLTVVKGVKVYDPRLAGPMPAAAAQA